MRYLWAKNNDYPEKYRSKVATKAGNRNIFLTSSGLNERIMWLVAENHVIRTKSLDYFKGVIPKTLQHILLLWLEKSFIYYYDSLEYRMWLLFVVVVVVTVVTVIVVAVLVAGGRGGAVHEQSICVLHLNVFILHQVEDAKWKVMREKYMRGE